MENTTPVPRLLAFTALFWLACALGTAVATELDPDGRATLSPISSTFSEFVFTNLGARLVGVSMLALSFASLAVALALIGLRAPGSRPGAVLIVVWSGCLVAAAIFPMEPLDMPLTWYGAIHRYASLVGFGCLAAAGLILAHRFRESTAWQGVGRTLRVLAIASLVGVVVFVATFVVGGRVYSGLIERMLLGTNLAMVGVLALAALRLPRSGFAELDPDRRPALADHRLRELPREQHDLLGRARPDQPGGVGLRR